MMAGVISATGLYQQDVAQSHASGLSAQKLAAEQAWPAFFKAFRAAVNKRDRAALKKN
jgi:peptide methionine sulfoxide reductase MsrB